MKQLNILSHTICFAVCLLLCGLVSATPNDNRKDHKKDAAEVQSVKTCVIKGRILDQKTSEPLAGVALKVTGSDRNIYTDLDGNYTISNVIPGKCEIKIDMISYEAKTVILNPDGNQTIDLCMSRQ